jgi:hypothetical protein
VFGIRKIINSLPLAIFLLRVRSNNNNNSLRSAPLESKLNFSCFYFFHNSVFSFQLSEHNIQVTISDLWEKRALKTETNLFFSKQNHCRSAVFTLFYCWDISCWTLITLYGFWRSRLDSVVSIQNSPCRVKVNCVNKMQILKSFSNLGKSLGIFDILLWPTIPATYW